MKKVLRHFSRRVFTLIFSAAFVAALCGVETSAQDDAQQDGASQAVTPTGRSSAETAKLLSSRNPLQRREAAEEIARAAATEHLRLVEGYRMQEKDSRVRLALDWALYRMGKQQALFAVVRELDTSRGEQAFGYLKELEGPEPLYIFLTRVNGNTQIRLLEVLARIGDTGTLEEIKPFFTSLDPVIADAARFAEREITIRLEETPRAEPKRPRQTGVKSEDIP